MFEIFGTLALNSDHPYALTPETLIKSQKTPKPTCQLINYLDA